MSAFADSDFVFKKEQFKLCVPLIFFAGLPINIV